MKDYFNILGVDQNASNDDIKKAYKRLAMKHHPDRGGDQAKFQEIQEAYDTLTDPQKRGQWEQQRHFGGGDGGPGHFHFNFGFGQNNPFGANFDELFRQFGGGSPFRQVQKNRDLRMVLELDLESTLEKQVHHINVRHTNGVTKMVEVEIPRGVQTGMQMRFTGQGDHAVTDIPPGDLYIDFRVRPHQEFRISGIHLTRTLSLNCIDAIIGTTVKIKSLEGSEFEITVPPGTQNQTKFRIPNYGLWDINQPLRGDLYLEVSLFVPIEATAEQIAKLQKQQ